MKLRRRPSREFLIVAGLFVAAFAISFIAMRLFRGQGIQPWFYQGNFEPAVMMACGRGFVASINGNLPVELLDFLQLRRNDFSCAALDDALPQGQVTWNATWFYLYAATAGVWKLAGISWTALDGLVALFGAIVSIVTYGLFRVVAGPVVSIAVTLLLLISPANLAQLLSLRDYSKAPFVLAAILLLVWLVTATLDWRRILAVAAAYGAVVGLGYGFRGDLAVMLPFGLFAALFLLPGQIWMNKGRNVAAAAMMLTTFTLFAWPALTGLTQGGGCQFHYALLGLTRPLANELGMAQPTYQFGAHFLDTFVDLKTGDYAGRVLGLGVPNLCAPDYDVASGALFRDIALTLPADLVAHAYGSVLMVLKAGLAIPAMLQPAPPFGLLTVPSFAYRVINAVTQPIASFGLLITVLAIAMAWRRSVRLGITLTIFVLFLTGYPAIEFEHRHWFHLRFIPWWAAAFVLGELKQSGVRGWDRAAARRALIGSVGVVLALLTALTLIRVVQTARVSALITEYLAAPTAAVPFTVGETAIAVQWTPIDYAVAPNHRASDLLVVTLDPASCSGDGPLTVTTKYAVDAPSHDMGTATVVARPRPSDTPTRLFIPVFWQAFHDLTYMRFSGLEVGGAPQTCIKNVERVTNGGAIPLWIEAVVSADWADHRLYQTIRAPRPLRSVVGSW